MRRLRASESWVGVAAGYPGTSFTGMVGSLAGAGGELGIYVKWSLDEKVALETACRASPCGMRHRPWRGASI